jgi:hypothetical protein
LAVVQDLGLDPAKVNPMGGAIALGHPLGATGAIRSATTIHALHRNNLKYGMVTMCVGTGMGARYFRTYVSLKPGHNQNAQNSFSARFLKVCEMIWNLLSYGRDKLLLLPVHDG